MRGTIQNSGCVSNATRQALAARRQGEKPLRDSFRYTWGERPFEWDDYQMRADGSCWRIEKSIRTVRIKKAEFLAKKAEIEEARA